MASYVPLSGVCFASHRLEPLTSFKPAGTFLYPLGTETTRVPSFLMRMIRPSALVMTRLPPLRTTTFSPFLLVVDLSPALEAIFVPPVVKISFFPALLTLLPRARSLFFAFNGICTLYLTWPSGQLRTQIKSEIVLWEVGFVSPLFISPHITRKRGGFCKKLHIKVS